MKKSYWIIVYNYQGYLCSGNDSIAIVTNKHPADWLTKEYEKDNGGSIHIVVATEITKSEYLKRMKSEKDFEE